VDSALFDFAEAAMGNNASMSWSLSAEVLRRQVGPVFVRCASGDLSAEEALEVAMEFVDARVQTMLNVFNNLFTKLNEKIDLQMQGAEFPALLELEEFFLGLNSESQWATDSEITKQELHTLFEKVHDGRFSTKTGVCVFCDTITSKKEYYLALIHGMCLRLTMQIFEARKAKETQGPERLANGDD
jgi:hypothetical protein